MLGDARNAGACYYADTDGVGDARDAGNVGAVTDVGDAGDAGAVGDVQILGCRGLSNNSQAHINCHTDPLAAVASFPFVRPSFF